MAALRLRRRPAAFFALALLGGLLLPTGGVAQAAASPTLQVTPEVKTADANNTVTLTATIFPAQTTNTTIDFEVMNGPAAAHPDTPGTVDTTCTVQSGQTQCIASVSSTETGISLIRGWIDGSPEDMHEARLANTNNPPALDGDTPPLLTDPVADCRPADPSTCRDATPAGLDPVWSDPAGDTPEPDSTDVVEVTFPYFTAGRLTCRDHTGSTVTYKNAVLTQQTEQYTCTLTTTAGAPIVGAYIDGKYESGSVDATSNTTTADKPSVCHTGNDGTCTFPIDITKEGYDLICFWARPPAAQGQQEDHSYGVSKTTTGKDCSSGVGLKPDSPIRSDITSVVYLDYGKPRAEGLDVQPENLVVSGASRFNLRGTVYDQFGQPYPGNTALQAKLFPGSILAPTADTNMANLDQNLRCNTGSGPTCTILTDPQNDLGTNLACVWLSNKAPTAMVGDASQDSSTCTAFQEVWQSAPSKEARFDDTSDDGPPSPVTDGLDVIRFSLQSRPAIFTVTPSDRRQATTGDVLGIDGVNFLPSALITVSGTGVTLGPTAVVSDKRLEASLVVAADAPAGARDVTVTNRSDGGTVVCAGCFRVIGQGYWMVASDGGIFNYGDAKFVGSAGSQPLSKPIVALTPTPSGNGYWLVSSDGGVFNYGDATFIGSAGALNLTRPIVSMAATPSGRGYWLVATDGGVFGFGDAKFYGATSRLTLSKPIVSIVPTPTGRGYWLVSSDGGIFGFGDAKFYGSTGDLILNQPIVALAPTQTGKGYWMVAADGGIFAFGDATYYGSTGNIKLTKPIVGMTASPLGKGYWMVATDGGIFAFGDARFFGSTGNVNLNKPIVGIARR